MMAFTLGELGLSNPNSVHVLPTMNCPNSSPKKKKDSLRYKVTLLDLITIILQNQPIKTENQRKCMMYLLPQMAYPSGCNGQHKYSRGITDSIKITPDPIPISWIATQSVPGWFSSREAQRLYNRKPTCDERLRSIPTS